MILWFAGTAVLAWWYVFRDPAIDLRVLIAGALLPDVVDAPFGGMAVAHALPTAVGLLVVVMLATIGRRSLRRRLLFLPIGMLLHLVFDGAFTITEAFWWPLSGGALGDHRLPVVGRGAWNVVLEAAGAAVLVWAWRRFRLDDPQRRRRLALTGRVDRALVDGRPPAC